MAERTCPNCGRAYTLRAKHPNQKCCSHSCATALSARERGADHALQFLNRALSYDGDACLLWPYNRNKQGYGRVGLGSRMMLVTRILCERDHGPPPTPRHEAAHSCGNGHNGCVTRKHLRWKTHQQNMAEAVVHGTITNGRRRYNAKLTDEAVAEIRSLRGKVSQRKLGAWFGVSHAVIGKVQRGEDWAHISD